MTVKAKVTLWYSALMAALMALMLFLLFSVTDQVYISRIHATLRDVASDAVKNAEFSHGELIDEDIDFYRDGVSIFLYDTDGHLLAPKVRQGIKINAVLQDQSIKAVTSGGESWIIHDVYAQKDDMNFWVRAVVSLSGTLGAIGAMTLIALIAAPLFIIIAALGGYRITKRSFAPVKRMARTADAISTGSDLSLRVEQSGSGDELDELARTLNSMLERLYASFEAEKQFTADASHELRTPIAVIISQCEYALSNVSGDERKDAIEAILSKARAMSGIISQLLMLARSESGKFCPQLEKLDLSELLEMAAQELEPKARERGVELITDIEPGAMMLADQTLMLRLAANLIDNAINYGKQGGFVKVGLSRQSASLAITVADNGVGIRPEDLNKIWRRFYRADPSGAGSGLGLTMVDWIARVHGGSVSVKSVFGLGSEFCVTFPLEPPAA